MDYRAVLTKEGSRTLVDFPDCPGCQTFAERRGDIEARAREALEAWLESYLQDGEAPPRPPRSRRKLAGDVLEVFIDPGLAVRLQIRWARQDRQLSQGQLAKLVGVSRQQISLLEAPDSNLTLASLRKVADALGMRLDIELRPKSAA